MPQPLFAVGQEFTATRDHDNVPGGSKMRIEQVSEPRPGEFEYTVEFNEGRRTILQESTLRILAGSDGASSS
jgi:hypothetical protein